MTQTGAVFTVALRKVAEGWRMSPPGRGRRVNKRGCRAGRYARNRRWPHAGVAAALRRGPQPRPRSSRVTSSAAWPRTTGYPSAHARTPRDCFARRGSTEQYRIAVGAMALDYSKLREPRAHGSSPRRAVMRLPRADRRRRYRRSRANRRGTVCRCAHDRSGKRTPPARGQDRDLHER